MTACKCGHLYMDHDDTSCKKCECQITQKDLTAINMTPEEHMPWMERETVGYVGTMSICILLVGLAIFGGIVFLFIEFYMSPYLMIFLIGLGGWFLHTGIKGIKTVRKRKQEEKQEGQY